MSELGAPRQQPRSTIADADVEIQSRTKNEIKLTNSDRTYGDSTHGVLRVGSRTLMVQEKGAAELACFVADVNPEGTFGA